MRLPYQEGKPMVVYTTSPPLVGMFPRLLTAADLAVLPTDLPSGPVKYELDNGKLIIMAPPGYIHGRCENIIAKQLAAQGEDRGHGKACGEVGVQLRRNPDRVVGPDAAFIANRSLPVRLTPEGYLESMPDLVVEVRSKNDSQPEIEQKVNEYLHAGVRVVWVPDPERQTVTAYRSGQPPQVFGAADTLTVPDVIPGFTMPVQDVFAV
jgi:Uma2 family endonuclease